MKRVSTCSPLVQGPAPGMQHIHWKFLCRPCIKLTYNCTTYSHTLQVCMQHLQYGLTHHTYSSTSAACANCVENTMNSMTEWLLTSCENDSALVCHGVVIGLAKPFEPCRRQSNLLRLIQLNHQQNCCDQCPWPRQTLSAGHTNECECA